MGKSNQNAIKLTEKSKFEKISDGLDEIKYP